MNLNLIIDGFMIRRASEILINPVMFRSATVSGTCELIEYLRNLRAAQNA